jgi:hypothetical protein
LGRRGSPERALGRGGSSVEGLAGARLEERLVAPVIGLEGTGASWWSLGMRRQRQTKTRGGQRREGAPAVAVPNDARRLTCAVATCGERRE